MKPLHSFQSTKSRKGHQLITEENDDLEICRLQRLFKKILAFTHHEMLLVPLAWNKPDDKIFTETVF